MNKNVIIAVYFHSTRDADLIALSSKVGKRNFAKICKYAVLSLVEPAWGSKARELCALSDMHEEPTMSVRVALTASQDELLRKLMAHLKPRTKGVFIKQVIRYTLGAGIILPFFLEEDFMSGITTPVTYTAQFVVAGNNTKYTSVRRKPTRGKKTTKPVSKVKIDNNIQENTETSSYSGIFNTTKEPANETNVVTTKPETDTTADDADEILAMLNNMLG